MPNELFHALLLLGIIGYFYIRGIKKKAERNVKKCIELQRQGKSCKNCVSSYKTQCENKWVDMKKRYGCCPFHEG